jgi:hypothetical protein
MFVINLRSTLGPEDQPLVFRDAPSRGSRSGLQCTVYSTQCKVHSTLTLPLVVVAVRLVGVLLGLVVGVPQHGDAARRGVLIPSSDEFILHSGN